MERQTMIAAQRRSVEKVIKSRRFWKNKIVKTQRQVTDYKPKNKFEAQNDY